MRRIDIINAAANVRKALEVSEMSDAIRAIGFTTQERKVSPEIVVSCFYKYQNEYSNFGAAEKQFLKIFGLNGLESPKILASAINGDKENSSIIRPYYSRISFVLEYLPKIIELLRQDNIDYNGSEIPTARELESGRELITIVLPEGGRELSSPERLVKALESISIFYGVLAKIENLPENDLSVAAIDSGSDKSFDFLGAAKLVAGVKEIILGLWDRVVYYKEKKFHEKLELISKSLPILESINSLEVEGKLGREQCEILRRNILTGGESFLASGAIMPEFSNNNYHNPRVLMAPEAKLLVETNEVGGANGLSNDAGNKSQLTNSDTQDDDLTEEEREFLKRINAKKQR